jgi:hypothetical protein
MALFSMNPMLSEQQVRPTVSASARRWPTIAQSYGLLVAAGFSFFIAGIPVQVSDSLGNLVSVQTSSWPQLMRDQFWSSAFFRPLLLAQTKLLLDLSGSHYFFAFRAFQVVEVFLAVWLFVRLLKVRTAGDCLAAVVAVTVLTGSHTFAGTIREAYPINNYLTVAICCLVALNVLIAERPRWYTDVLVILSFVLAVGTIETGLIVWGCLFIGRLVGWRGVSITAFAVATLLLVGYFGFRFGVLSVATPSLMERSSGFGFARLEPMQLNERFGASPYPFYLYNVASSIATVLFSEPRAGVWMVTHHVQMGMVEPWMVINVTASCAVTLLVAWFAVSRRWWSNPVTWSHGQRLVAMAAAVILANGGISFPYTKDQIMSLGGMLFAAALFAAAAARLESPPRARFSRALTAVLLCVVSVTWSWRVIGLQHNLVHTAFTQRNDWAYTDLWIESHPEAHTDPGVAAIVNSLYLQALRTRVPNLHLNPFPLERYFDHHSD